MSLWPPFFGAGIRVKRVDSDLGGFEVEMKLHWYNRNYVGTHYGGSLYSMADPFYMLILMEKLGPGYTVWDKAAMIRFRKPGRGRVRAAFEISDEEVENIRRLADQQEKLEPVFTARVIDEEGDVVAEIEKTLHVRKRKPR
jgi:acyl-coenzyme A thioesterase PaaI-like protein